MKKLASLKKLIAYYKPYKLLFFLDLLLALISSICTLIIPLMIRSIINKAGEIIEKGSFSVAEASKSLMLFPAIIMLCLIIIAAACNYFMGYYGHVLGAYIERNMRTDIFAHYMKLSFSFYDNQKVGNLLSRVTSDLFDITELLHHGPEDVCISIITIVGATVILFHINVTLSLVLFAIIVIIIVFISIMNQYMGNAFSENRKNIGAINSQIEDSLSGIRAVKSFGNEKLELNKFEKGNDSFLKSKKKTYKILGEFFSGMTALFELIKVVVLIVGIYLLLKNKLTQNDLLTFILYLNAVIEPIFKLGNFTEMFQNGYSGYSRFLEIMATAPDIADKENALELKEANGAIEFKNVSFGYNENDMVLANINLSIKKGEYVAIVGPSGAGKTTICSLIPRFYELTGGQILIDNIDITDIKLKDLRSQIGIVQQDVYIFAGTVAENIAYGKENASMEEIINAAKAANAHDFIMELKDGYDSDIGQRGVKLSGGQKQRISIARVFLKNPAILILDEATSALDNNSERIVQESFENLAKNRTTLVIAHRLSTIRNAKRILVCAETGIVQDGTHDKLMQQDGIYKDLNSLTLY